MDGPLEWASGRGMRPVAYLHRQTIPWNVRRKMARHLFPRHDVDKISGEPHQSVSVYCL